MTSRLEIGGFGVLAFGAEGLSSRVRAQSLAIYRVSR